MPKPTKKSIKDPLWDLRRTTAAMVNVMDRLGKYEQQNQSSRAYETLDEMAKEIVGLADMVNVAVQEYCFPDDHNPEDD